MRYKQAGNYPTAESTRSMLFNLNCMRVSHIFFFLFYPCKNKMKKNCGNLTMATRKVVSVPLCCGSYKNNQWSGYNIPTVCILSARDSSCCIDRLVLLDHDFIRTMLQVVIK